MEKAILVPYDKYQRLLAQIKDATNDSSKEVNSMTEKNETQDRKQVPTINSTKIPVTTNTQMKLKMKQSPKESGIKSKMKKEPRRVKLNTQALPPGERDALKQSLKESGIKSKLKNDSRWVKVNTQVLPPGKKDVFKNWISF